MLLAEVNNSTEHIFERQPKIILMRLLLLFLLSIWIIGFFLPIITSPNYFTSNFLFVRVYSTVCHQESVKCISIDNASMMVCARCAGIYFGTFTAGLLSLLLIMPSINRRVLILSAIPLGMDVLFVLSKVYAYSQGIAFVTGLVFGGVVYLLLLNELENLFSKKPYQGNE